MKFVALIPMKWWTHKRKINSHTVNPGEIREEGHLSECIKNVIIAEDCLSPSTNAQMTSFEMTQFLPDTWQLHHRQAAAVSTPPGVWASVAAVSVVTWSRSCGRVAVGRVSCGPAGPAVSHAHSGVDSTSSPAAVAVVAAVAVAITSLV